MENSEKIFLNRFEGGIEVLRDVFVANRVSKKNNQPYMEGTIAISIARNKQFVQKLYEQINDEMDGADYQIASKSDTNPDLLYLNAFYMYESNLAVYNEKQKKVDSLLVEKAFRSIGAGSKLTVCVEPKVFVPKSSNNGELSIQLQLQAVSIAHLEESKFAGEPLEKHLTAKEIEAGLS